MSVSGSRPAKPQFGGRGGGCRIRRDWAVESPVKEEDAANPAILRHPCVGRNPFGAQAPQTGRRPVSIDPPGASSFPRRRESRPIPMTNAPCADAPSIPYDGPRRAQAAQAEEDGTARGGAPFCTISAPFCTISAPKQPHRRPIANPALGVNGAKWCRMERPLKARARLAARTPSDWSEESGQPSVLRRGGRGRCGASALPDAPMR